HHRLQPCHGGAVTRSRGRRRGRGNGGADLLRCGSLTGGRVHVRVPPFATPAEHRHRRGSADRGGRVAILASAEPGAGSPRLESGPSCALSLVPTVDIVPAQSDLETSVEDGSTAIASVTSSLFFLLILKSGNSASQRHGSWRNAVSARAFPRTS